MTEPTQTEPDHPEIQAFWDLARFHARLNVAPGYFGPTTLEVVPPPSWSYGDTGAEADRFAAAVRAGEVTSTEATAADYADEDLPGVGSLSILCDGYGKPAALLETATVETGDEVVVEHFRVVYRAED